MRISDWSSDVCSSDLASILRARLLPTSSSHRLGRGLPGYLILFAPHAFVPQCQCWSSQSPSPQMFLPFSTHFTAKQGIPIPSTALDLASLQYHYLPEPGALPFHSPNHLTTHHPHKT